MGAAKAEAAGTTRSASACSWWPIQRIRSSADATDAGHLGEGGLGLADQGGVDGVHQPAVDLAGGVPEHDQDRDGDQQTDDRVGQPPAERDAAGAEQRRPAR